jgi:hypothetical protein
MALGTALHCAVLEPEKFRATYVTPPKFDRRTTAGKTAAEEFEKANADKLFLPFDDHQTCLKMSESVWHHPMARELLSGFGKNEVCAVWTDKLTGLRCKCLIDRLGRWAGWSCLSDVKTCQDASPSGFAKAVYNLGYHERVAYYLDGLSAISPAQRKWFWIAVEKERPYAVAVYEPDEEMLLAGRQSARQHLSTFAERKARNVWPGYSDSSVLLRLPRWAAESR